MKTTNTSLIGGFVVGAIALIIILLLVFNKGKFFAPENKYVIYFEGSVNGLNVGAPVKLKGVTIGSVTDVLVQYDVEQGRVQTPVIAEVDLDKVTDIRVDRKTRRVTNLSALIDRGLRARLASQSLVTGQLYVDVNFYPEKPAVLVGETELDIPEIPSIPSSAEEIENTIGEAISKIRKLPIEETSNAVLHSAQHVDKILGSPEAQATVIALHDSLIELKTLTKNLNDTMGPLSSNMILTLKDSQELAKNLNARLEPFLNTSEKTLNSAQTALASVETMTERQSSLDNALIELSQAARALRQLADTLERNPESLIYGKQKGAE